MEEAVAAAKETLAERAAAMSEQFSGEYMRFSLVQLNGCWYVTNGEPMEEPGMADYGAESPEDAISMLLAGLAEQDWDAVTNMLAPNTHNDTVNTLMSTLTVTGYEIGELREDEDGNYVAPVTITGSLDVEIWADINIEHDLEALHLEGLSADEVEAKRDALTAAWKEKAAALNARLVAGASLEAIIGGTSGGRYVVTQLLGDPE